MASRTQRIAQHSFEKALAEMGLLEGKLEKLPKDFLGEIAKEVASDAKANFAKASYAGPQEHIDKVVASVKPRQTAKGNWSVTAKGEAVSWIEFGTGYEGDGTSANPNVPESYQYEEQLGNPKAFQEGPDGPFWGFKPIGKMAESSTFYVREQGHYSYRVRKTRDEYGQADFVEEEVFVPSGSFTTQGNPANDCMYKAFTKAAKTITARLKEYMSK